MNGDSFFVKQSLGSSLLVVNREVPAQTAYFEIGWITAVSNHILQNSIQVQNRECTVLLTSRGRCQAQVLSNDTLQDQKGAASRGARNIT